MTRIPFIRIAASFIPVLAGLAATLLCHAQSASINAPVSPSNAPAASISAPATQNANTNAPTPSTNTPPPLAATNTLLSATGTNAATAPSPFDGLDLHSTFPVACSNLAATLALASSKLSSDLSIIVQTNITFTTNVVAFTNANLVVVITNAVPSTNLVAVVTNAPPPSTDVAVTNAATKAPSKVQVMVFPPDKEVIVVATEDCSLMSGQQKLVALPGLTVLVVEAIKGNFANVIYNGTNGWVSLDKCFRIGRSPPEAEIFCRKGLILLSSNDLNQARMNLYIAATLEPSDRSYLSFYKHLSRTQESLINLVAQYATAQRIKEEAKRKAMDAEFLQQQSGLDAKSQEMRQKTAQDKAASAKIAKEEAAKQEEKLDQDIKTFNALFSRRIENCKADGLFHMAAALGDYKRGLAKNPRYTTILESTNFVAREIVYEMRNAVTDSCSQYEASGVALASNMVLTASRALDVSLKTWPKNKIARKAKEKISPAMEQIEQLRKKTQQLKQDNDLLGLEITYAAIAGLTKDYEKLDELVAQNRKILVKARELATAASQCFDGQKPFECQDYLKQALAEWKSNPEVKPINDRLQEKHADVLAAQTKIAELGKNQKFAEIVTLLQGFKTKYAKDSLLARMEADFQSQESQLQEDLKKAQALEKENKKSDAFEIYVKRNSMDSAKRLARVLGREAENKGEKDKAISFYERAGLNEDVKRLRPPAAQKK